MLVDIIDAFELRTDINGPAQRANGDFKFGFQLVEDVELAPSPRPVAAMERLVVPSEPAFSGFVFKIHANMDPNHRSCIAFVKVCSSSEGERRF